MKAMREVWGATLADITDVDERLVVLDGDLANSTKADVVDKRHPDRFLQMGIAEQNMVGVAVGLASTGHVPWLSSFAIFLTHRAIDPVRMLVAQTGANVKIAGAYAGLLTGLTGRTHQDVQDLAIMRAMPGMTVLTPADDVECAVLTRWAHYATGPVYLRLARDPVDRVHDAAPFDETTPIEQVARPQVLHEGNDVVVVSCGAQTTRTLAAVRELAARGVSARMVHLPVVKPLDPDLLRDAVAGPGLVCTVEEHSVFGGLGGLVAEVLAEGHERPRVHRIGLADVWTESAPNDFLLDRYGLSTARVVEQVLARV